MATAAKAPDLIPIDEYLNTSYRPDVEYLDGILREKPAAGFIHGEVQGFLFSWFSRHYQQWNIRCAVETRPRVSASGVRLPDVVVIAAEDRRQGALDRPPLIAIEVLSPTDTYKDLKLRAADPEIRGVPNIWLIDEEARTCAVWREGAWQPVHSTEVHAVQSPLFLDLAWLWAQLNP